MQVVTKLLNAMASSAQVPKIFKPVPVFSALLQKGGAGKTTVNITLAEYCSIVLQKRVLLIDVDPQCNMSTTYLEMEKSPSGHHIPPVHPDFDAEDEHCVKWYSERSDITEIYKGKLPIPYPTYIQPDENNVGGMLDIIPGNQDYLTEMGNFFTTGSHKEDPKSATRFSYIDFAFRLSEFLARPEISEDYDLVILDAGPTDNLFFRATIYAASHIICPYTPDEWSLDGVATLMSVAKDPKRKTRGFNSLNFLGIMPSKIKGTSPTHKAIVERNMSMYGDIHLPEGIFMKDSDQLVGRKTLLSGNKAKSHSIFYDTKATSNRKHFEQVMGYLSRQIFGEAK